MLVLTRKKEQRIIFTMSPEQLIELLRMANESGEDVMFSLNVVLIQGDKVRLGVDAPRAVTVLREELYIQNQQAAAALVQPQEGDHLV